MKAEVMWENSLACWFVKGMDKFLKTDGDGERAGCLCSPHDRLFRACDGSFYYHRVICLVLLLIFSGMEAYLLLRSAVEHYQVYEGVEKLRKVY